MNTWYAKKRDEKKAAYKAALDRNEVERAQRLFAEYERYAKAAKGGES